MNTSTTYAQLKEAYSKTYGYAAFPTALQLVMNHGCDAIRQMCRKDITDTLSDEYNSTVKDRIAELALLLADTDSEVILAFAQRDIFPIEDEERLPPLHPDGDEEGICPICGGEIDYCSERKPNDYGYSIDWECPECGATGHEEYSELFTYHSNVCDKDGKEVEGREF